MVLVPRRRTVLTCAAALLLIFVSAPVWADAVRLSWTPRQLAGRALGAGDPLLTVLDALSRDDYANARKTLNGLLARPVPGPLAHELNGYLKAQEGDLAAAEAAFRTAVRLSAVPRAAHAAYGEVLFLQGKLREAGAQFETFMRANPKAPAGHVYLARIALAAGDPSRAIVHFEQALKAGTPQASQVLLQLASVHVRQNDLAKAQQRLSECSGPCQQLPAHALVLAQIERALGRGADAERRLHSLLDHDPTQGDAWVELAAAHRARGDLSGAVRVLEDARRASAVADSVVTLEIASLKLQQGDLAGAMPLLARLVAAKSSPEAYVLLSQAQASSGKTAEAGQTARAVVADYPAFAQGHLLLGLWSLSQRQNAAAARALNEAVRLQPDLVQGWIHLSNIESVAHRTARAEQLLRTGLKAAPNSSELHYYLGLELEMQHRWRDAAAEYARAVALQPDFLFAMNNRARLLVRVGGDLDEAEQLMRAVVQKSPREPLAQANLGWVLVNRGKAAEGLPMLERAVAALPDNAELQYFLSLAYKRQGREGEAAERLRLARALGLPREYEIQP
jgi:predicted Zn-dependent protease